MSCSSDRELVYDNINKRVDGMFKNGLVNEVKELINKYNFSVTAKEAIGYKEVLSYFNNELSLEECVELIKKRSRNYAKRQVTFFKHQFECETYGSIKEAREAIIHG